MTVKDFEDVMLCNEPDFHYRGITYSICWPGDGYNYCTSAWDKDGNRLEELEFSSVDDMLDNWLIDGKPLRERLPDIEWGVA